MMGKVGHIIKERLAAGTISGQDTYTIVISGGNAINYIPKRVLIAGKNNDIKIPRCNRCDPEKQSFYKDLFIDHEITCRRQGNFQITKPGLDTDLVGKKLKAENISCAKCEKEEI